MAEPLDPAALGVASALKSLRTRIGLREERLRGTELVLDTLTGLDEAEVDASVLKAQRASAAIVARFQAQPDVAQVNVREGYGDPDRQIPDVSNWSMAEYARNRGRLGTAPQDTMSFLSGGK